MQNDPANKTKPRIGMAHPITYHAAPYPPYGLLMSSNRIPINMKYKAAGLMNLIRNDQ